MRSAIFALGLGLGLGCADCVGGTRPIVSVDWLVDPAAAAQGLSLPEGLGQAEVRQKATGLSGFSVRPARAGEVGWQLTVGVRLATDRPDDEALDKRRRALGLVAELRALGSVEGPSAFSAEVLEQAVEGPEVPTERILEAAVRSVMARLATSVRLAEARPDAVASAILGDDPHARAMAVRLVQEQRLREAGPALDARLGAADLTAPEVLRIAAALAALERAESVGPLIEASSRFPQVLVPMAFQLARLGGREAEAYLFTLQSGHDRPEVRQAAGDALRELRRSTTD